MEKGGAVVNPALLVAAVLNGVDEAAVKGGVFGQGPKFANHAGDLTGAGETNLCQPVRQGVRVGVSKAVPRLHPLAQNGFVWVNDQGVAAGLDSHHRLLKKLGHRKALGILGDDLWGRSKRSKAVVSWGNLDREGSIAEVLKVRHF